MRDEGGVLGERGVVERRRTARADSRGPLRDTRALLARSLGRLWSHEGRRPVCADLFNTTYVGCDDECRDEIIAIAELEALRIDPATGISWHSDPLNPRPGE